MLGHLNLHAMRPISGQYSNGGNVTGIIIFGLAALFLGLRLYSVLGKRTGHEQSFAAPEDKLAPPRPGANPADENRERGTVAEPVPTLADEEAAQGLRAIAAADRSFTPDSFIEGASGAYRMILEAYWQGRLDDIAPFVAPDVLEAFTEAAAARETAGEILDNRLITIERAVISAASLENGTARITVRFDADIAAVTKDKDGKVIAGSLTDAVPTHDAWTFGREVRSADPNWVLIDTDEAE
jgi:predicted lipid-binding transport protein (Tim44 family)